MSERLNAAISVIGGGPAGAAAALRLSQMGHSVVVVEKKKFPRAHIGESLSPGVLPLLDSLGIKGRMEHQGFLRPERVLLHWPPTRGYRPLGPVPGLQVDRAKFDAVLLQLIYMHRLQWSRNQYSGSGEQGMHRKQLTSPLNPIRPLYVEIFRFDWPQKRSCFQPHAWRETSSFNGGQ